MERSRRVAILLATYNGEKYLEEQIRSLLAQTYPDFVVIARDDHSSDRTPEILARWSTAQPDRFRVVCDDRGNLRPTGNFSRLMEVCDTPYFSFCDQDDIWLPNKIDLMVTEIRRLERQFGETTPILLHSDLTVVGDDLREISPSLFRMWQVNLRNGLRLDHLLINNFVAGCALIGNRPLLELGRPIPDEISAHDWWVALIAASCGVARTIAEPTVLYRQHGKNEVGAGRQRGGSTFWEARHILRQPGKLKARMRRAMLSLQSQACVLLRIAGPKMPRRNREFLRAFCLPLTLDEVAGLPWRQRTWLFARHLIIYARAMPLALRRCY